MTRQRPEPEPPFRRRRALPPPPPLAGSGEIEGLAILKEMPSDLGYLLWGSLRNVLSWAETPATDRRELFERSAYERRVAEIIVLGLPERIEQACLRVAHLFLDPVGADPDILAGACVTLAGWAQSSGHDGAGLEFISAAALCCPHEPVFALRAGREARELGRFDAAEAWYRRAIVLSRSLADHDTYVRAHLSFARMLDARGDALGCRRHVLRAVRSAERHGLGETAGMAYHEAMIAEAQAGHAASALRFAGRALEAYGAGHRLLVNLGYDLATICMDCGAFRPALQLHRQLLGRMDEGFRAALRGAMARAAGVEGLEEDFDAAREALAGLPTDAGHASGWVDVAQGAMALGRWTDARLAAELAQELARASGDYATEYAATQLLPTIAACDAPLRPRPAAAFHELAERTASGWVQAVTARTSGG